MAFRLLKKRRHKVWLTIILGVIAVVLFLAVLINSYWSPILAQKVHNVVISSSDSLYTADFSDAELHILRGELVIYNLNLKPDTAVFNRRKLQHLAPNNLVELHIKRLIIKHIHPFRLYFKHVLDIGTISLNSPELNISYQLNHTRDTVVKDNRTVWQKISKSLHSIHVGNIFLNDVKLKYKDYSGNKVLISELKEMNLGATDLLIDSATQFDRSRLLYCREIIAELHNYSGKSKDGLYNFKVKHLKLSTLTSKLNIEGFSLQPVKPGSFFDKTTADRYTAHADSIELNHFDYLSYHKYRTVHAESMIVYRGDFSLFDNPNGYSSPVGRKMTSFPSVALRTLTTDLQLDTVLVKHINVNYSEYNKKSKQSGYISFDNISGHVFNITNNKLALASNNICTAAFNTYFMNRGRLQVQFAFNLTDKDAAYSYKGFLGPMDLEAVNPATMPFAMVKITSGAVEHLSFDIKANSHTASGQVELLYHDLKVKVLKPDSTYGFKGKLIESLYANIFIIKHDNPDKPGDEPRKFNVTYNRPDKVPFFGSVWQTLLSGIKPSAGLDKKTEQATAQKMHEQLTKKQQRQQRRALRQQRRAERKMQKEKEKKQEQAN